MYHEYSNKCTCRLCSSDIAFDGEGAVGAHTCAVSGAEPGTEHRITPNPPHKPVRGILISIPKDRETEAERSGGFLRSQPVSGGPGITAQGCLTEKSTRCSRDHTLLSATGCSAYDLLYVSRKSAFLFIP